MTGPDRTLSGVIYGVRKISAVEVRDGKELEHISKNEPKQNSEPRTKNRTEPNDRSPKVKTDVQEPDL